MARGPQKPTDPELEHYLYKVGKHVKAQRELRGLSQEESARQAGIPVGSLRDIEQGYDARLSHHCLNAKHLELPFGYGFSEGLNADVKDMVRMLGVSSQQTIHELHARIGQLRAKVGQLEETMPFHTHRVTRRTFNTSSPLVLLNAVFPEPIRGWLRDPGCPPLSAGDVEVMHDYCDDLDQQYRALGGGAVFDLTIDLHERVMVWFRDGGYPEAVKRGLVLLGAQLKSWVGWFAYDTEQLALADRFLNEAITYARIARCPYVEIHALDNLCALQLRKGDNEQALRTADVGLIVTPASARRTCAVFHMRRLAACAQQGDEQGFLREAEAAQADLDRSPGDGDRRWSNWAVGDIMRGRVGRGYVDLGRGDKAEPLLRTTEVHYHHNDLLDNVYLCHALAQQGALSEASEHATGLLTDVMTFESDRIHRTFHQLYGRLASRRLDPNVRDFVHAYDEAMARSL